MVACRGHNGPLTAGLLHAPLRFSGTGLGNFLWRHWTAPSMPAIKNSLEGMPNGAGAGAWRAV